MRRRIAIPLLIAVLAAAWTASSDAVRVAQDGLIVTFDADFAPHVLPRSKPAPVNVRVTGKIATADGSHPPPLRQIEVAINRNGRLETTGLPVCTAPVLQSTSSRTALARCRGALVGRGRFHAVVKLGREVETSGEILAFNSRRGRQKALVLHLFSGIPVRFTLVIPLTVQQLPEGDFGTVLRAKIPRLAGDLGSVTEINLTIGRRYSFGGRSRSYVSAACRAPSNLNEALFPFAKGSFHFEGHAEIRETLLRLCRVR
ncbi:MAG TPA: hypothetical protein VF125_07600 [Solirubrobacterales bacterium]